jgi:ribosomal protein S6--L-glutamate ligase
LTAGAGHVQFFIGAFKQLFKNLTTFKAPEFKDGHCVTPQFRILFLYIHWKGRSQTRLSRKKMILSFHPCFDADVQIVLGDRNLCSRDLKLIGKAEAVILPQGCPFRLYRACSCSDAHLFPNYEARFNYPGKIGQSLLFEKLKCRYPETLRWPTVQAFKEAHGNFEIPPHALPFLIKSDRGHEGEGIYLVKDENSLKTALERLSLMEKPEHSGFVTQAFVPSEGNVLRAVILGNRVETYWKRPVQAGSVITTVSRGARTDSLWRPRLQEKGAVEARAFSDSSGVNLAAVDFVFPLSEPDPEAYFLEVNYYFARRGLGGSLSYYKMLYDAIRGWLTEVNVDPGSLKLL